MILIADSGATKTDWALVTKNKTIYTDTIGFSPMFQTVEFIVQEIADNDILTKDAAEVSHIYFYGTGCSSLERNNLIKKALGQIFAKAVIKVDHDIAGAVLATCEGKPGIACILGTGSNVVFFDGNKIHQYTSALGYILGDEAGGAYFGRRLLADYINHDLPPAMQHYFEKELYLQKETIYENVYQKPNANRYLGSFSKVLSQFKEEPYVMKLLKQGFDDFITIHIQKIPDYQQYPIHFVGSIADVFKDVLTDALKEKQGSLGRIVKNPIQEMVKAVLKYEL